MKILRITEKCDLGKQFSINFAPLYQEYIESVRALHYSGYTNSIQLMAT
jgi:hypothetical protein